MFEFISAHFCSFFFTIHTHSANKIHQNQPKFLPSTSRYNFSFFFSQLGTFWFYIYYFSSTFKANHLKIEKDSLLNYRAGNSKMASNLDLGCILLISWGFGLYIGWALNMENWSFPIKRSQWEPIKSLHFTKPPFWIQRTTELWVRASFTHTCGGRTRCSGWGIVAQVSWSSPADVASRSESEWGRYQCTWTPEASGRFYPKTSGLWVPVPTGLIPPSEPGCPTWGL